MTSDRAIRRFILQALGACGQTPMPDSALNAAVRMQCPDLTAGDVALQAAAIEQAGLAISVTDDLAGKAWSLTIAGKLKAAQLAG